MQIQTTLRDREVTVKLWMQPAEPDVGILSAYVEDYKITDDETGEKLDWELDDDEQNRLAELAEDNASEPDFDY